MMRLDPEADDLMDADDEALPYFEYPPPQLTSAMIQPSSNSEQNQAALELLAQMRDPQWLQAAARPEDEANCDISAGRNWGDQLGKVLSDPAGYYQHKRLRTLVFRELRQLLAESDLGVGLKAAQSVSKALIIQRLRSPSTEIQSQLMAVLAEDQASAQDIPLSASARESLRQVIQAVLLPEDWETISTAAAIALQEHFSQLRFIEVLEAVRTEGIEDNDRK